MMKQVWNIIKRFLVILPVAALFLFMYNQLVLLERTNAKDQLIAEQRGHVGLLDYMILHVFDDYEATLELMSNANEFQEYLERPSEETQNDLLQFFIRMANNRPYLMQTVLYNLEGEPLLGYDTLNPTGPLKTDPFLCAHVQSMLAQSYKLDEKEVGFSSICNCDNDFSSASISVAAPVWHDGSMVGLLAIVADGTHIRGLFDRFLSGSSKLKRYSVVDSTGRAIYRSNEDATAGFIDPETQTPLQLEKSELWERILNTESSEFSMGGENFYWENIKPLVDSSRWYQSNQTYWTVVVSFHDEDIPILMDSFILQNEPVKWIIGVFILLLGGIINVLAYFRKNDKELLLVSNLVAEHSHDGVFIADPSLQVTYCNPTLELMSGYSKAEFMHGHQALLTLEGEDFRIWMLHRSNLKEKSWKGYVWLVGKGHLALVHLLINAISNNNGLLIYYVGLISNTRNLSREPFEKFMHTHRDSPEDFNIVPLQRVERKIKTDLRFSLLYVKLPYIEEVEKGLVMEEHYLLSELVRARLSKVMASSDFLIQYSPDTYLLSLLDTSDGWRDSLLKRLFTIFEEPLQISNSNHMVRILCGVSRRSENGVQSQEMLSQARMALATLDHYRKSGFLVYDEGVNEQLTRYYDILQVFPRAIAAGDIKVYFQPVVHATEGRVIGAEALARWQHPALGPVSPVEFLPIVEQNGMERLLGDYVLKKVVAFLDFLKLPADQDFYISMNLCPTELQDKNLVPDMVRVLDEHGVPHRRLVIELTERTLLTDLPAANSVLAGLRKDGIRVAIDDFGTGFSSLSYLKNLKVDTLKIDRSFIKDYPEGDDGSILKAIVGMAFELDMHVVAEGVETQVQLDFLRQIGCGAFQGFLFSRAVDSDRFMELLKP